MSPAEYDLAADLLELAADQFSCHGCNDYEWPEGYPAAARASLLREEITDDPEHVEHLCKYGADDVLMRCLASRLRRQSMLLCAEVSA